MHLKNPDNFNLSKDLSSFYLVSSKRTLITVALLLIAPFFVVQCFADQLTNALHQRIGNYDIQMKTEPKIPIANEITGIILRISSVNGDEIVDLPIIIRISKDNVDLSNSTPIFVQYGHYTFNYRFPQPGIYAMNVRIQNDPFSNQDIIFTFPINISNKFVGFVYSFSYSLLSVGAVGIAITIFAVVIHKKNSKTSQRK
jgi:hypothetical protein